MDTDRNKINELDGNGRENVVQRTEGKHRTNEFLRGIRKYRKNNNVHSMTNQCLIRKQLGEAIFKIMISIFHN